MHFHRSRCSLLLVLPINRILYLQIFLSPCCICPHWSAFNTYTGGNAGPRGGFALPSFTPSGDILIPGDALREILHSIINMMAPGNPNPSRAPLPLELPNIPPAGLPLPLPQLGNLLGVLPKPDLFKIFKLLPRPPLLGLIKGLPLGLAHEL